MPLHRENGTLVGAIGFAWSEPTTFDAKLKSALSAVADLCTATIEGAERYDAEHELIVEMHRSLLGAPPTMAGIEVSARYLPASENHRSEATGTKACSSTATGSRWSWAT